MRRRPLFPALGAAAAVMLALASPLGCGDDDDGPTDTTTATDTATDTAADTTVADTEEPDATETTATDAADVADVPPAVCGTDSPEALAACVEASRLEADLASVAVARPTGSTANADVRDFIETRLESLGFTVELDDYGQGVNVIATKTGATTPGDVVVISAHYDSVAACPGADDNGSGVVGALEAARVLATTEHDRTLIVALWDGEEQGLIGSYDWVERAARADMRVVVSLVFEMIGYTSSEPNSQTLPTGFGLLFGDAQAAVDANEGRGDFIALVTGDDAAPYSEAMVEAGARIGHKAIAVPVTADFRLSNLIGDLRRSDHTGFWLHGWPAMMITDTANFRNPNYHCAAGPDAVADLDFDFAADTVAITVHAAALALDDDAPTAGVAPAPRECDLVGQTGCEAGEKCNIHQGGGGFYQPTCVALSATPKAVDETCDRPGNVVGEDDCDAGLFCTFWGLPSSTPQARWCRTVCEEDSACPTGERCQALLGASPGRGMCIPTCDPFDADACTAEGNCVSERPTTDRTAMFGCARVGTKVAGEACTLRFDECAKGLMCATSPADGVARCGAVCDSTHPCLGDGDTCVPLPNPSPDAADTGIGTCQ